MRERNGTVASKQVLRVLVPPHVHNMAYKKSYPPLQNPVHKPWYPSTEQKCCSPKYTHTMKFYQIMTRKRDQLKHYEYFKTWFGPKLYFEIANSSNHGVLNRPLPF